MGWLKKFISNPVGAVTDTAKGILHDPLAYANPTTYIGTDLFAGGGDKGQTAANAVVGGELAGGALLAGGELLGGGFAAGGALPEGAFTIGDTIYGADGSIIGFTGGGAAGGGAGVAAGAGAGGGGLGGALGLSAGLGALGNLGGAYLQSQAQKQAANTQQQMFNTINRQEQPFIGAGYGATSSLSSMLSPGGYLTQQFNPTQEQLQNYPGYKFALETGGQAIRNADTPGMGALSGAALKDLMKFNQNLANTYYGDYFNQFQTQQNNIFNRLSGLATLGQNAAGNLGSVGANLGTGIAQAQAGAGASLGAGVAGAGNTAAQYASLPYILAAAHNK